MKKFLYSLLVALVLFTSCKKEKRLIHLAAYRCKVEEMYQKTRELAKGRDSEVFSVMDGNLTAGEEDAMKFLLGFAPLSDLADCDGEYFLRQVRTTLQAREEMPWGKEIPEEVFLHFVLPLRVNNENLDTFRSACYEELKERVKNMNLHDAALEVNHWCHEKVTYKGSDERTSSPLASMRTSWGRCGEESTFTVSALRAVGIPARQVYTPRWAHTDDNHAWVEVWVKGKWYYMGACEPDAELNRGWFTEPSKRTMLVHTRAYGYYMGKENVIDREERFSELNLISHYAPSKTFTVKVKSIDGQPVQNARVEFRLYNYAEYYPIARLFTDREGETSITTGLGDLLVWATDGENVAYQKISAGSTRELTLSLSKLIKTGVTENLDIVPPPRPEPSPADTTGQAVNKLRFSKEDSIRKAYMSAFAYSAQCARLSENLNLSTDSLRTLLYRSQGNWKNLSAFLKRHSGKDREFAFRLLFTLTEKDLRDVSVSVLDDHLSQLPGNYYGGEKTDGKEIYLWYVASPRIHNEMIRKWRHDLKKAFASLSPGDERGIQKLLVWIKENVAMNDVANLHSRAPLSPAGLLQLKVSDSRSRNIFFVAACRSLGFAARINPVTLQPEYLAKGKWNDIQWENTTETKHHKGYLHLIPGNPGIDGRYMQHFTISKLEKGRLSLYEFDEGKKLSEFDDRIELDTGLYLLVTGNRMSDGGVLSTMTFFDINTGQTSDVIVSIREPGLEFKELSAIDFHQFELLTPDKKTTLRGNSLFTGEGSIFIWVEPAQEPSRHVLVDIPPFKENFEKWKGKLVFIVRDNEKVQIPDPVTRGALPSKAVYCVDKENAFLASMEEKNNAKYSSNLPLIVYLDPQGKLWLISEGYSIGTGEILGRIIAKR
jgi:hypothetical protein